MSIKELIPDREQLEYIQGVEEKLLKRRRTGLFAFWIGIAGATLEVVAELLNSGIFTRLITVLRDGSLLSALRDLSPLSILGFLLLVVGLGTWFFLRYTRVLLHESREPFRYTFWIKPFERIGDELAQVMDSGDIFHPADAHLSRLLSHDLMDRLSQRIKRLSLLQIPGEGDSRKHRAHIEIEGHYTVRTTKEGWLLQVMPRVSIGGKNAPRHLIHHINFPMKAAHTPSFTHEEYKQVVERIYSRLATEIYNQIQSDLREKVKLFPTSYLRASALAVEAEDFARSNTIDAYGHAIELYESALRYFKIATFTHLKRLLLSLPFIWTTLRFHHKLAEIHIGYAKSTFYKWYISTLSGRKRNSIYALPARMDQVTRMLTRTHNRMVPRKWRLTIPPCGDSYIRGDIPAWLTENRRRSTLAYLSFPPDNWLRSKLFKPPLAAFQRQQKVLFEAYLVSAIAYLQLNNVKCAREMLKSAEAIRPGEKDQDALYLMASGILEPKLRRKILLLRKATEAAPDFEIAQFMLASKLDLHFRNQNHLQKDRAEVALREYQKTLGINHGNLSALTAMAYIHWLIGENTEAKELFEQGLEFKTIFKQTYSAEIYYGLARIYAEGDRSKKKDPRELQQSVVKAYEYFNQAISIDPSVGIYFNPNSYSATTDYYYHISPAILSRLEQYYHNARAYLQVETLEKDALITAKGVRTMAESVFSYVLNDYGNAALNYFFRFGSFQKRDLAEKLYTRALEFEVHNKVAHFGKALILRDKGRTAEARIAYEITAANNDNWEVAVINLVRSRLEEIMHNLTQDLLKAVELEKESAVLHPGFSGQSASAPAKETIGVTHAKGEAMEPPAQNPAQMPQDINARSQEPDFTRFLALVKTRNGKVIKALLEDFHSHFEQSNLGALFENGHNTPGQALIDLLENPLEMERLREKDVRLLQLYNEILLHDICNPDFLTAIEASGLMRKFFISEDFLYRKAFFEAIELRLKWEEIRPETEGNTAVISQLQELTAQIRFDQKQNVEYWLEEDMINYSSFTWAQDYLEPGHYMSAIDSALDQNLIYQDYELEGLAKLKSQKLLELGRQLISSKKYNLAYPLLLEAYDIDPLSAEISAALLTASHHSHYNDIDFSNLLTASQSGFESFEDGTIRVLQFLKDMGHHLKASGNFELALECYSHLLRTYLTSPSQDQAHAYGEIAECLAALQRDRLQTLQEGASKNPESPRLQNLLGIAYFETKNFEAAFNHFANAADIDPDEPQYFCNKADALLQQSDFAAAMAEYDQAIEVARRLDQRQDKSSAMKSEAYFVNMKGLGYYNTLRYHDAAILFEEASRLDPTYALYHANLGNAFINVESFAEAQQAYEKAVFLDPRDDSNLNWLGIARFRQGDFKGAASDFNKATELNPGIAQYHINLANSYKNLKKIRKARQAFLTAARFAESQDLPTAYLSYNDAGVLDYQEKKFEKSLSLFQDAHRLWPHDMVVVLNIADSYLYQQMYPEAEAAYRQALAELLNRPEIHSGLAETLYHQGNFGWAIDHYMVAYRNDPHNDFPLLRTWRTLFELPLYQRQEVVPFLIKELHQMQNFSFNKTRKTVLSQLKLLSGFKNQSLPLLLSRLSLRLLLWSERLSRGKYSRA